MSKTWKVSTIVGTRPELIRLSRTIPLFDKSFHHRLIHTNQNFDPNLKDVFFEDLKIRKPDNEISISRGTLGDQIASILIGVEKELLDNRPDAVVILGDTNSALSSIIAKRMQIPVYHLEAGNRSHDSNIPEEINRRIIDHCADFNLVYSEYARRNLEAEGIESRRVSLIGSPLTEVIRHDSKRISESRILESLNLIQGKYFLISAHRQENIDNSERLLTLLNSIASLDKDYNLPIIISAHPRFSSRTENLNFAFTKNVRLMKPFNFTEYCKLQLGAKMVLSDSGSLAEEAAILKFKAVSLRDSTERPEAIESGTIITSGLDYAGITSAMLNMENAPKSPKIPWEYEIEDTSHRITRFITSTISQHKFWSGLR
jgi:UDP-N-acetylglucosamine 2-epimerase